MNVSVWSYYLYFIKEKALLFKFDFFSNEYKLICSSGILVDVETTLSLKPSTASCMEPSHLDPVPWLETTDLEI